MVEISRVASWEPLDTNHGHKQADFQHAWKPTWTKLGHQVPYKERIEFIGFRQASAVSRIKRKWAFYCRVVNIDAKN